MYIGMICGTMSTGMHGRIDAARLYEERALTGSESSFFNVARGLAELGHRVVVYCDVVEPMESCPKLAGAAVKHLNESFDETCDAYISLSEPDVFRRLPEKIRAPRVVQFQYNDLKFCKVGYENFIDVIACLSPVHRDHIAANAPLVEGNRIVWVPNSINMEMFDEWKDQPRIPHSMAWFSSPDRGLHRILEIFPNIRKKVPDATLNIFYRFEPWFEQVKDQAGKIGSRARYIEEVLKRLGKNGQHGITLIGPVPNRRMAKVLAETDVMPYTCDCLTFTEGFCVAALDACASGVVPILSDTDAIGDIYRNVAYEIPGKPGEKKDEWIDAIVRAMTDHEFAAKIRRRARLFSERFSRQNVAKLWEILIRNAVAQKTEGRMFDFSRSLPKSIADYAIPRVPEEEAKLFLSNDPTELREAPPPPPPAEPPPETSPADMQKTVVTVDRERPLRVAVILGLLGAPVHGTMDIRNIFTSEKSFVTGTVSGFMNIAWGLAERGLVVDAFCDSTEPVVNSAYGGANFYPLGQTVIDGTYDAYISVNEPDMLRVAPESALRLCAMWLNDFSFCQPGWDKHVDKYVCPSESLRDYLGRSTDVSRKKMDVISLSINMEFFRKRVPKRPGSLAYCSSPDRGLHHVLEMFPEVRKRVPEANLRIYYRFEPWFQQIMAMKDLAGTPVYTRAESIGKSLDALGRNGENGVTLVGPLPTARITEELLSTKVLAYTCDPIRYTEGFSVTTLDACAAGCVPIISGVDALPEIYDNAAVVLPVPSDDEKKQLWIDTIVQALTDDRWATEVAIGARIHALSMTRGKVAKDWEALIRRNLKS
jgi:glycosyltransferase involved in cell wall biosynthesis